MILFAGVVKVSAQQSTTSEHLHLEPVSDWVNVRAPASVENIPIDEVRNGIFYQLLDEQIKVDKDGSKAVYKRYIETITNQTGVEASCQINISFDPLYQKLVLNSLDVVRNGKRMDRLSEAKISVFSRETELDKQIYNGRLTLNILLDDVQVGDTLDYSYTRLGSNPVYKNLFSYARSLNWADPVFNQNVRVLWGKATPLQVDFRNTEPPVSKKQLGAYTEYEITLENIDALDVPSETPGWYDPYGSVYFNELDEWREVVDWARPMYQFSPVHSAVREVADDIKRTAKSEAEQVAAALKYTQETVRYVGLEMGRNSHLPTAPQETLTLKYGDCKDKTTLFISILKALNIEAHPALVDTRRTKLLAKQPVSLNLFDHVLVWIELDGKEYWLDPTLSNKEGDLANLYQPDYGYALVLKDGVNQLSAMQQSGNRPFEKVVEKYEIPASDDSAVVYTVSTQYKGYDAIRKLWQLERDGKNGVATDYEEYYQRAYAGLKMSDELVVENNNVTGVLTIDESYSIFPFWIKDDDKLEADFYSTDIRNAVFEPEQSKRNGPLKLGYPNNLKHTIELAFEEDDWEFDSDEFKEDNDFFSFISTETFVDDVLTLHYEYEAKTDHVPQERVAEYLKARNAVYENSSYGIDKGIGAAAASVAEEQGESSLLERLQSNWFWIACWAFLLGVAFVLVSWQLESRDRPNFPGSRFYPIAVWKFVLLSVVSFGIYISYWMYRNWKAVKLETNAPIMPFWRAVFSPAWVYPLFLALKKDSEETYAANRVLAVGLAVLVAAGYIALSIVVNVFDHGLLVYLYVLAPLLLVPFVQYIRLRNQEAPEAYHFNSRFRARHVVAVLLSLPLVFLVTVNESRLFPSDAVVTQSGLLEHDLKFLYRQKIIPPRERIQYFYSDAFLSIKTDGNGFTNERVFSY
ncbi:MAG: DUF3857 domain-containing protein [Gammaproteobacteria bacterium]